MFQSRGYTETTRSDETSQRGYTHQLSRRGTGAERERRSKQGLEFNLGVYLYLQCLSLQGAVTVIVFVGLNQNSITQKVVLHGHQVPQAGGGSLRTQRSTAGVTVGNTSLRRSSTEKPERAIWDCTLSNF